MAITVKHTKVSSVPDSTDTSLVRPSDWNADHTLVGVGTAASLDAGVANGVATLDSSGKVPTSQIPMQGDLNYQGTWNATTNSPTLTSSTGTKGYYYVVDVAGTTNLNGITDWQIGDWAIFNGSIWQKVDNTDAVTSVNGQVGTVVLGYADVGAPSVSGANATGTWAIDITGNAATATKSTNLANGSTGQIAYQSAPNATAFVTAGASGQVLSANAGGIPTWITNTVGDVVGPSSATDNAIARFDTTTGKLIQNSVVTVSDTGDIAGATTVTDINYVDFNTAYATTLGVGQIGWDGNNTLGLGMAGGNVIQKIGEDTYFYVKASSAITKGQLCMFTGAVGSSGVVTAAPSTAIPYAEAIIGVAAEDIALNGFGLIQNTGSLKGVDTSAFLDGDVLYYDSAVTGGLTKTYPTSGSVVIVAAVAKSGSGGSGVLVIRVSFQTRVTGSTGISVSQGNDTVVVTNTAPDQTVVLNNGTGISVTGTYPNFTVTNTAPSSGGTVTSVTGTAPISSSGGTTPAISISMASSVTDGYLTHTDWNVFYNKVYSVSATGPLASTGGTTPAISISQATTSTDGYLSSTDWNTFNNKQPAGSYLTAVTADAPLSGSGTSGSHLVIATANTTTTGALSSTDWNTFNGKANAFTYTSTYIPYGQGTTTPNQSSSLTFDGTTQTAPIQRASNGLVVNSKTVSASYSIASGDSAMSVGPVTVATGQTVTIASGSRWVVL